MIGTLRSSTAYSTQHTAHLVFCVSFTHKLMHFLCACFRASFLHLHGRTKSSAFALVSQQMKHLYIPVGTVGVNGDIGVSRSFFMFDAATESCTGGDSCLLEIFLTGEIDASAGASDETGVITVITLFDRLDVNCVVSMTGLDGDSDGDNAIDSWAF